ncbi:D-alanyl-D-alanine carboxypeptidase/D-alanyl-D-alanine-endopeptidase [Kocuria sp.]|uniref:D-alanyl-D-alanine carboxypeptidase/D-alanyl-D-alanine endopeptidase n=1 Tax=Kocuria sp. TaxID=1871328 RepID=UPI0026DBAADD|nr:D-alanyl-D-alanine carboxypeptidase/D-alanyl-D-alanine-endopeptidase [Kocuria sp.]MDO4919198.1 D-alanyl-D-alanine carboxypeptidase/D-alanyl-D-alanine-endopeptidase [Kocuria sp.]
MVQTPSSPRRRTAWAVVCALLLAALCTATVLVVPAAVAEIRPALVDRVRPEGTVSSPTASSSPGPVSTDGVREALISGLDGAPGTAAAAVTELGEDTVLAGDSQTRAMVPASNQKLLTALSLAEHVGPYERLATTVVAGEDPRELTLVAGGDSLLAPGAGDPGAVDGRAGLGTLAQRTARALRERSQEAASGPVTVAVDTSLFTGPDRNPAWQEEDLASGEITRVSPIALYSHRVPTADGGDPGDHGDRPDDPSAAAAEAFVQRLQEELGGAQVTLRAAAPAPQGAAELARVESAPVHEQAAYMLAHSDNSLAETLARVAAVRSGREGGVAGVRDLLPTTLRDHGVDVTGLEVLDASGMAPGNRVTPVTLAQTVSELVTEPRFGPYGQGLPVAGGAGTLATRFDDPAEAPARGVSRAKTGTLLDVVALSGYAQREDGRVLAYSLVLNGVSGRTDQARDRADRTVAALARSA